MGKVESWTDVDYAQAAIDMLPGTVEEIEEFLPQQKIKNQWVNHSCPIERWVSKWTDGRVWTAWIAVEVGRDGEEVELPVAVCDYILAVDRKAL